MTEPIPTDQVERQVFAEFAECCPLGIRENSIQSRPEPEPDIICETKDGEKIAFELVRCDDKEGSQSISRGISLKQDFREFLSTYSRRKELLEHLEGRDIQPYFRDGVTERQIRNIFPSLCEFLLVSDVTRSDLNPYHPIPAPELQKILQEVSLGIPKAEEPILYCFPANWILPAEQLILEALNKKRMKVYRTDSPKEILVWFGITPDIERELTWAVVREQAPTILNAVGFRRLWVYSWAKHEILWTYQS